MHHYLIPIVMVSALLVSGCAWVKLTPQGEKVRVLEMHEVSSCKEIGKTRSSLVDKLAGIQRHKDRVQSELDALARNSAAEMGGDTVVRISEVKDGKQTYGVYKCVGVNRP